MYWSGSQFYNLSGDEMDLEEVEKVVQLNQVLKDKQNPGIIVRILFFAPIPKKMPTKKKEKKKANLPWRARQTKQGGTE